MSTHGSRQHRRTTPTPSRRRRLLTRAAPLGAGLIIAGTLVALKVRGGHNGED